MSIPTSKNGGVQREVSELPEFIIIAFCHKLIELKAFDAEPQQAKTARVRVVDTLVSAAPLREPTLYHGLRRRRHKSHTLLEQIDAPASPAASFSVHIFHSNPGSSAIDRGASFQLAASGPQAGSLRHLFFARC